MSRLIIKLLGFVCLIIGCVGMLTPLPLGLVFFILALLLLIPTSPNVARATRWLRKKSPRVDRFMAGIIKRLPSPYRRILRATEVDILDRHSL